MEKIYTVKETADILKTSIQNIYSLIRKNQIKVLKCGRYKIRESELERYIEEISKKWNALQKKSRGKAYADT